MDKMVNITIVAEKCKESCSRVMESLQHAYKNEIINLPDVEDVGIYSIVLREAIIMRLFMGHIEHVSDDDKAEYAADFLVRIAQTLTLVRNNEEINELISRLGDEDG